MTKREFLEHALLIAFQQGSARFYKCDKDLMKALAYNAVEFANVAWEVLSKQQEPE